MTDISNSPPSFSDITIEANFSQLYNPDYANVTVIDKRDSPRARKYSRRQRLHETKANMVFYPDEDMYYCSSCGCWVLKQHKERHMRL